MSHAGKFVYTTLLVALPLMSLPARAQDPVHRADRTQVGLPASVAAQEQAGGGVRGLPLKEFLAPDGTLNLPPEGIEGSIDPTGFRLVSGPGEEPRFVEEVPDGLSEEAGSQEEAAGPRPEAAGDECWESRFSSRGFNGQLYAIYGTNNFYVGGDFTAVGGLSANNIAYWNSATSTWSALGSGTDGIVRALAYDGTYLYAGGTFSTAGGVTVNNFARWNISTSTWSAMGSGTNSTVYALAYRSGTGVYAGGSFTTAGGSAFNYLALWNGSAWTAAGSANGPVYALNWDGTYLWAGGSFTSIGGTSANYVARFNGSAWSALGSGTNNTVNALLSTGTVVYVGGQFTTAGGAAANYIAAWTVASSSWSALGTGMNWTVNALIYRSSVLYAGGSFTTAGGSGASYIAQWNGTAWTSLGALGTGPNARVNAMSAGTTYLNLVGDFDFADNAGTPAIRIARCDWSTSLYYGTGTAATGDGVGNVIQALVVGGTSVYAGGQFNAAGGVGADRVAKWDGTAWSAVGAGPKGDVYALAWDGTNLYAGGQFIQVGSKPIDNIAKWTGTSWNALGSGTNASVNALAWDGTNLYAGGSFGQAGGITVNQIAKWNGTGWSALGSGTVGVNSTVYALAWDGSSLYVGGAFATAGGITVNRVAKWDGANWNALGLGVSGGTVYALTCYGGSLYAGGTFTSAGGASASRAARWDGSAWSRLGGGLSGSSNWVNDLLWHGAYLYATGYFTTAEGFSASRIARWDGTYWSALGSGLNVQGNALAESGDGVWVGGAFRQAGLNSSFNFALWADPPSITAQPASQSACTGGNASFSVTAAGHTLSYQWQEDIGSGWANVSNGGVYSGATTTTLTLTGLTGGMFGYRYRCIVPGYCGTVTSTPATLLNAPIVTSNPSPITACTGGEAAFSVTAFGASTYQWQANYGSGWGNIVEDWVYSGTTTPTLYLVRLPRGANGVTYRCVATNACAVQAASNAAALTVCDTPPSVGTLYLKKTGNNQEIYWTRIGNTSLVDSYELMRSSSPTGPFDTLVGTTTGDLSGLTVDLSTQPPTAYYEVRAVKGTCTGPLVPQRSIWLFDEGAGNTAYDSVNSNHGMLYSATWAVGQGKRGSALDFNGTNAFVSAVYPALPTGGMPYTLMAWVRPDVHATNGIIGWGDYGTLNKPNALRLGPSGTLWNYWWNNDLWATTGSLAGAWHHVAATWDGVNRTLYLDGAVAAGPTAASGLDVPDTGTFRIGSTNFAEYFDGLIDEVAVFDEALGQSTIQSYMNSGFGTMQPLNNMEAVWHFDEGGGTTISDSRGYHPAMLHGGTWTTGQSGSAVDFNGTSDYAEANPGAAPTGPITIVAKVWLDSYKPWSSFVEKFANENLDCWSFGLNPTGQKLTFMFNNGAPTWANSVESNSTVPLGQWVQVAVASNGATATFYLNGAPDGTFPVSPICASGLTFIGVNIAGGDEYFDGIIDDLEIFDRYLTQAEIQALQ